MGELWFPEFPQYTDQNVHFSTTTKNDETYNTKKQEKYVNRKRWTETVLEEAQAMYLLDKNFKSVMIKLYKEL